MEENVILFFFKEGDKNDSLGQYFFSTSEATFSVQKLKGRIFCATLATLGLSANHSQRASFNGCTNNNICPLFCYVILHPCYKISTVMRHICKNVIIWKQVMYHHEAKKGVGGGHPTIAACFYGNIKECLLLLWKLVLFKAILQAKPKRTGETGHHFKTTVDAFQ